MSLLKQEIYWTFLFLVRLSSFFSFIYGKTVRDDARVFGLLDPDPDSLERGTDPDPSILKQNSKKILNSYCFVTSLWLFIFEKWCKCSFKIISKKKFLVVILKITGENTRIRIQSRIRVRIRIRVGIRIRQSEVRVQICGSRSRSVPKCQGSATMDDASIPWLKNLEG